MGDLRRLIELVGAAARSFASSEIASRGVSQSSGLFAASNNSFGHEPELLLGWKSPPRCLRGIACSLVDVSSSIEG